MICISCGDKKGIPHAIGKYYNIIEDLCIGCYEMLLISRKKARLQSIVKEIYPSTLLSLYRLESNWYQWDRNNTLAPKFWTCCASHSFFRNPRR